MTSTHLGPEPSLVFTNASGATSPNGASLAAEPIRVIVPIVVHPREVLLLLCWRGQAAEARRERVSVATDSLRSSGPTRWRLVTCSFASVRST